VVLLLSNLSSLTQLYTLTMDVHARLRTDAHQTVTGRARVWRLSSVHVVCDGGRCYSVGGCRLQVHTHTGLGFGDVSSRTTRTQVQHPDIPLPCCCCCCRFPGRFNERLVLSLASCPHCLIMDDELNVLPTSTLIR
jgi:hypothetical protein